jgi:hypothetical protein
MSDSHIFVWIIDLSTNSGRIGGDYPVELCKQIFGNNCQENIFIARIGGNSASNEMGSGIGAKS